MAKVTVLDIINTRHHLKRFENYARRHMDNLPISQANGNVAAARELLRGNVDTFENCDVTELTPDTTEIENSMERCRNYIDRLTDDIQDTKQRIKDEKKEAKRHNYDADVSWERDRIADYKEDRRYYREQLAMYQEQLDS